MGNQWTPEQENAIQARRGTLLVSAAAGSGKTSVLSERVTRRLLDKEHPCSADELLIVTFTRAAAAEMKQRISERLLRLLQENPLDVSLQRQILALERAHISTIHSFCSELIRSNFHKLDISPAFRIASDSEMNVLRQQAAQTVMERMYIPANRTEGFLALTELMSNARDDKNLIAYLLQLYDFVRSTAFPKRWLEQMAADYADCEKIEESKWGKILLENAAEQLRYLLSLAKYMKHTAEEDGDIFASYGATLHDDEIILEKCLLSAQAADWDRLCALLREAAFGTLPRLKKSASEDVKKKVQEERKQIKELFGELKESFCFSSAEAVAELKKQYPLILALKDLLLELWEELERLKKQKNILDYGDLEHYALKLLVRPTDGGYERTEEAVELSEGFVEVMIDEYQDTNEAQNMIFSAISKEERNLFLVGDVKQSIYRFRQAMPELFIRRRDAYPRYRKEKDAYPATVILDRNFRSREGITQGVNFIFRQLMSREMGEIDYNEEESLVYGAKYPPSDSPDITLEILRKETADDNADAEARDNDTAEAAHIAQHIRKMIASGQTVTDKGKERLLTYKDCCILLESKSKHGKCYLKELTEQGIPAWTGAENGFFDMKEIRLMLSLLRVIDNPMQDVPLLAVMMSPLYGFTPDDMALLRKDGHKCNIYTSVKNHMDNDGKIMAFLQEISYFRTLSSVMSADCLLRKIYEKKHIFAVVRVMKNGELRGANLRLLLEYAKDYESISHQGLSGFIRYIDRLQAQSVDLSPAAVTAEGANAVHIMSIHHSKGLEFPVVFLAGCAVPFNKQDIYREMLMHPSAGVGLKLLDNQTMARYNTVPYLAVQLQAEKGELSERLRVLYVALTRAKEKLFLIGTLKNPEKKIASLAAMLDEAPRISPYVVFHRNNFMDWLILAALRHPDGGVLRAAAESDLSVLPCSTPWRVCISQAEATERGKTAEKEIRCQPPSQSMLNQLRERLSYRYPKEIMTVVPTKMGVSELSEQEVHSQFSATKRPAFLSAKGLTPAERGTALHRFMQFSDYSRGTENIAEELSRMIRLQYLTQEEGDAIDIQRLRRFFCSDLAKRMLAAQKEGRLHREVRFFLHLSAREYHAAADENEQFLVQGVADCIIEEADGFWLVDYKTDRVEEERELIDRYQKQLLLYARAMEKCFEKPIKKYVLYSFYLGKEIYF